MYRTIQDLRKHSVGRIPYVGLSGAYSDLLTFESSQTMSEPTVSSLKLHPKRHNTLSVPRMVVAAGNNPTTTASATRKLRIEVRFNTYSAQRTNT